jgi:hypothetical protein
MRTNITITVLSLVLLAPATRADQPHMQRALDHLDRAEAALQAAKANKAGHREQALEQIRKAKDEVRQGMDVAGNGDTKGPSDDAMRRTCTGEAAGRYNLRPSYIELSNHGHVFPASDGFAIEGVADVGSKGKRRFTCIFGTDRAFKTLDVGNADGK